MRIDQILSGDVFCAIRKKCLIKKYRYFVSIEHLHLPFQIVNDPLQKWQLLMHKNCQNFYNGCAQTFNTHEGMIIITCWMVLPAF